MKTKKKLVCSLCNTSLQGKQMNDRIREALILKYTGVIAEAEINVRIYLKIL